MDFFFVLRQLGHVAAAVALSWLAIGCYRWVRRRSPVLALIIGCGVVARVAVGLTLFWISYLELPVAQGLQAGGGFWQIAVDATRYYAEAAIAIENGVFQTDYSNFLSPFYVRVLALFMLVVGISPVTALFLNVCIYVAVCLLLVWMYSPVNGWRRDLPCIVAVGAYSFWPSIFIHSTQPLKDDSFYALIVVVCLGALVILRLLVHGSSAAGGTGKALVALVIALGAISGLTDIRWYFPIIIMGALALVLAGFAVRGRSTRLAPYVLGSLGVLMAFWLAAGGLTNPASRFLFPTGAGSRLAAVRSLADVPVALADMARYARAGFLVSGGDTNIAVPVRRETGKGDVTRPETLATATPGRPRQSGKPGTARAGSAAALSDREILAARATPRTATEHVKAVGVGLAVVFVPISILKAMSIVEFTGGRGVLPVADLDTVFQDIVIVGVLWFAWTRRRAIGNRLPFALFCIILAAATAVLLGYVVTNYGTLFRMRPMIAMPLFALMVALSSAGRRESVPTERSETLTAA